MIKLAIMSADIKMSLVDLKNSQSGRYEMWNDKRQLCKLNVRVTRISRNKRFLLSTTMKNILKNLSGIVLVSSFNHIVLFNKIKLE